MDKSKEYLYDKTRFTGDKMPKKQGERAYSSKKHAVVGINGRGRRNVGLERFLGNVDASEEEVSSIAFVNLNKQVLKDITSIIRKNSTADLKDIIVQYEAFTQEIASLKDSDSTLDSRSSHYTYNGSHAAVKHGRRGDNASDEAWDDRRFAIGQNGLSKGKTIANFADPNAAGPLGMDLNMQYHGKNEIRNGRQALQTLFGKKIPRRENKDTLSMLLDENYSPEDVQNMEFNYIKLEDVVKSKGNSINGPKREDVGRYNRKLFDMQFNENRNVYTVSVDVNPRFFPELRKINETSEILCCETIIVNYFDRQNTFLIDEFFLTVHKSIDVFCTIRGKTHVLFDRMTRGSVQAVHVPGSSNIVFLYLDSFILYNLIFVSSEAASAVYELFFA